MINNLQDYDLRRYKKIMSLIQSKCGKLLDVGCGNGILEYYINHFCNYNLDIYGFDENKDFIKIAKNNFKNSNYIVSDGNKKFLYDDNSFDIVVCIGLLEHIEKPHNVVKEMLRVMKKDGIGIINTPNAYQFDLYHYLNKPILPEGVNCYFTPNILTGLIKKYNGVIKYVNLTAFIPFNLNFRRIYVRFKKGDKKT